MVLVSNEWQSNKDDVQKPITIAAPTATTTVAAATAAATTIGTGPTAAAVVNSVGIAAVTGSKTIDQDLTARPGSGGGAVGGDITKRQQQRVNKKNRNKMEINRKVEPEQTLLREKHETETCEQLTENLNIHNTNTNINNSNINNSNNSNSNDANDNLENQENNNTTTPMVSGVCDSNTNTLQVRENID